jgi:hypothetical protein
MRRISILICLLCFTLSSLSAQPTVFENIKIRRHKAAKKRVLVDKFGTLTFDDSSRQLIFKSEANNKVDNIAIKYDDVTKVVFEVTRHMRGGAAAQVIQGATIVGLVAGNIIAAGHINEYWFYIECKCEGHNKAALFVVPKNSSAKVIDQASTAFGSRVTVTDFPERGAEIELEDLKELKSKQTAKVDKRQHPLPELRPDKATVVVVCPPLAARDAGTGIQVKLHANDEVVAVNRMGTYSLAYLDPGKYRLVSQAGNANGFDMELEAGHQYYFLQNTFQQTLFPNETSLSRNSRELVMYLLDGSYYSDWKPK